MSGLPNGKRKTCGARDEGTVVINAHLIEGIGQSFLRTAGITNFVDGYGMNSCMAACLWNEMQTTDILEARVNVEADGTCIGHFLMTLYMLTVYDTNQATRVFDMDEESVSKWLKFYSAKIVSLTKKRVSVLRRSVEPRRTTMGGMHPQRNGGV